MTDYQNINVKKICAVVMLVFVVSVVSLYFIAGDSFHHQNTVSDTIDSSADLGEIIPGVEVRQNFTIDTDDMIAYKLKFATYGRSNTCLVDLKILAQDGTLLAENKFHASDMENNTAMTVTLDNPIRGRLGETVQLLITSDDASPGNAVSVFYGDSISAGRGTVTKTFSDDQKLSVGGTKLDGILYLAVVGRIALWFGQYYWALAAGVSALLLLWFAVLLRKKRLGQKSLALNFFSVLVKYRFLVRQLVSRDFKTKYRRSMLGVFWSFLNPLLTMVVQYVVFSTLFRASIPNYPVYLLSGIVLFNFFSETTSIGMTSITGNASLITKVYVPKYIYPLTRMLSSTINVLLALIPLFIVTICTGVLPAASWLLMIYVLLCMMGFSLGITYILSTMMVYFRDTQFLWGVVSMVWMYCTPLFYPESIIPVRFQSLYHLNPLYQLIRFARCTLIDRVSPDPMAYLICLLCGVVPLLIGIWIFNSKEKNFVLYL